MDGAVGLKGEFEKRAVTQSTITQEECNYSCRLDGKKFPQPDRQRKWVKLTDIEEARKDFPHQTVIIADKAVPTLAFKRINRWLEKWYGTAEE